MKSEQCNVTRMMTVSIQITEEEYQKASKIAARFYQGCFKGERPMDIRELAAFALHRHVEEMGWVLTQDKTPPSNVTPFPLELTRR